MAGDHGPKAGDHGPRAGDHGPTPGDSRAAAARILRENDRGGFNVPTPGLYPFQWLWDSGFTALGWAELDEPRAWQELETVFLGQWPDGMLPHIVFHRPDPGYFPGPDVWGTSHDPPTSGITQPHVFGTIVRRLLETARDRELAGRQARGLFPRILAAHRWIHRHRDPHDTGLVAVVHPWEGGEDNSPLWDGALARVPIENLAPYTRRDTGHVDASQRPTSHEYDRYLSLVARFRALGYEPDAVYQTSPFRVATAGFNSILQRSDRDLMWLASSLGEPTAEIEAWIERGRTGLGSLWDERAGAYRSRDLVTGEAIEVMTSSSFLPLFAGVPDGEQAGRLAARIREWGERVRYLVPSTDPQSAAFEPRRYWRGPVWSVVNWMIAIGLEEYGFHELASRVRHDTLALIEQAGFAEYFEPNTGEGLGGGSFSWTAAILLNLSPPA